MQRKAAGGVGSVKTRLHTFAEDEPFQLHNGRTLGPITLAYETYGQLNAARDNAILVFHALSGSQHAAGLPKVGEGVLDGLARQFAPGHIEVPDQMR